MGGHRQQIGLDGPLEERVLDLDARVGAPAAELGEHLRGRDDPRRRVADADVEDLAGADEVVEGPQGLLEGRVLVPGVDPEQVDVVGPQPLQARLHRHVQVLALVARRVRVGVVHRQRVLGGDHVPVPAPLQPAADDLLGLAAVILVRRVEEVATRRRVGVEDLVAGLLVGAEAPLVPEGHGAEADLGDAQTGGAEEAVAEEGLVAHGSLYRATGAECQWTS